MTSAEYQTLILTELQASSNATASANIAAWWTMFDDKGSDISDYVQYLYTKRQVIIYLLGEAYSKYDLNIGFDMFRKSSVFKNLKQLLDLINEELKSLDSSFLSTAPKLAMSSSEGLLPDRIEEISDALESGSFTVVDSVI